MGHWSLCSLRLFAKIKCGVAGICLAVVMIYDGEPKEEIMKNVKNEKGAIGWILLWALGIPIPILLLFFVLRGCT
jgi:hypothetical protein